MLIRFVVRVWKAWNITHLAFEIDRNGYAKDRDPALVQLAVEDGLKVLDTAGHSLYDPLDIVKANGNRPTMTLAQLQKAAASIGDPDRPSPPPSSLPPVGPTDMLLPQTRTQDAPELNPEVDLNQHTRIGQTTESVKCFEKIYEGTFKIPTMESMGLAPATTSIKGGEDEALSRLDRFCADEERVWAFKKPETGPTEFDPPATTQLSPYLHFGALGTREFYWRVRDIIDSLNKTHPSKSVPPENLVGQLLFRDMYYAAEAAVPNFNRIRGNPQVKCVLEHDSKPCSHES